MKLYINRYENKEYMKKLLGICALCTIETMKAEIEFVLEFHEKDDPFLNIKELTDDEIIFGVCQ